MEIRGARGAVMRKIKHFVIALRETGEETRGKRETYVDEAKGSP